MRARAFNQHNIQLSTKFKFYNAFLPTSRLHGFETCTLTYLTLFLLSLSSFPFLHPLLPLSFSHFSLYTYFLLSVSISLPLTTSLYANLSLCSSIFFFFLSLSLSFPLSLFRFLLSSTLLILLFYLPLYIHHSFFPLSITSSLSLFSPLSMFFLSLISLSLFLFISLLLTLSLSLSIYLSFLLSFSA
ncbi:unnamed protein product [Acanthosepion pharaonis]|uniref:Uncharacterized protein n=1 Tax=Acanthosepion pharaonis TaxID=158019 RepID=A0A812BYL6_ACAPH|nr:unnamed protein product [Sepia pharaonis]